MWLIVGGDSLIGNALAEYCLAVNIPCHSSTRRKDHVSLEKPLIDLGKLSWNCLHDNTYDAAVICAAISRKEDCESHPDLTHKTNVDATLKLIEELTKQGTYVLYLSSNEVFDGNRPFRTVDEEPCPISEYGRQKYEVERCLVLQKQCGVLRLTKVNHDALPLLVEWKQCLLGGRPIHPFKDVIISPIELRDVIRAIAHLLRQKIVGIHQLSGREQYSYVHIASELASRLRVSQSLIQPIVSSKAGFHEMRFASMVSTIDV